MHLIQFYKSSIGSQQLRLQKKTQGNVNAGLSNNPSPQKNISSGYSNGCTDNYVDRCHAYLFEKKKHFGVIKHFTATDDI